MIVAMQDLSTRERYAWLIAGIIPRPIALTSTLSGDGLPNLAPFSFFSGVSASPPILSLSIARKSGARAKDTLANIEATGELVVNLVSESIAQQAVIASAEFAADIDEFEKAGLTPAACEVVRPFRVAESPLSMECRLHQVIPVGARLTDADGRDVAATSLVLAEVLVVHAADDTIGERGLPDPAKLAPMGRLGGLSYAGLASVVDITRPDV